jgi:diguanylate cyclase (GGDEF)-like protein
MDAQVKRDLEVAEAQQMALRDDLTGVKNKRAYSQAEQTLNHSILADSGLHFAVVVCDINDLKVVNDTEGHGAGDKYIRRASNMICTIFNHSPVYRIGGDEFAVLLFGKDYEMRQGLMDQLLVTSFRTKSAKGHPLVSCGISEFEPDRDKTLSQVFERADNAMYQQKTRLKAGR